MRQRKKEKLLQRRPHLIMRFDEVVDSISSGHSFISRNGLGTRLVSNNSGGMRDNYSRASARWNCDGSSSDYHESWQNKRDAFWLRESEAFQKKYKEQMKCLSEGKIYKTKHSVVLEDRLAYYYKRVNGAMFLTASQKQEKRRREEEELEFRKRLEGYEKRKANGWLKGRDYEKEQEYAESLAKDKELLRQEMARDEEYRITKEKEAALEFARRWKEKEDEELARKKEEGEAEYARIKKEVEASAKVWEGIMNSLVGNADSDGESQSDWLENWLKTRTYQKPSWELPSSAKDREDL